MKSFVRFGALPMFFRYQLAQLGQLGEQNGELEVAGKAIRNQLEGERPWRDLASIEPQLQAVREAYVAERQRVLASHGDSNTYS